MCTQRGRSVLLQGVHAGWLLQLHAPEAHLPGAATGAVRAPAQEVSTGQAQPWGLLFKRLFWERKEYSWAGSAPGPALQKALLGT